MFERGWIKLDKEVREQHGVLADGRALGAWIYLLLAASHPTQTVGVGNESVKLESGMLVSSTAAIARDLQYSERFVRDLLRRMELVGMLSRRRFGRKYLFTLLPAANENSVANAAVRTAPKTEAVPAKMPEQPAAQQATEPAPESIPEQMPTQMPAQPAAAAEQTTQATQETQEMQETQETQATQAPTASKLQRRGLVRAINYAGVLADEEMRYRAYTIPTEEEVHAYAASCGEAEYAEAFFAHYDANAWCCAQGRVRNWRSLFRRFAENARIQSTLPDRARAPTGSSLSGNPPSAGPSAGPTAAGTTGASGSFGSGGRVSSFDPDEMFRLQMERFDAARKNQVVDAVGESKAIEADSRD